MKDARRFDVALSFAGEDRSHAQQLAAALQRRNVRVFYDEYEKTNLWGKDLYSHLSNIYSGEAYYCVMLLSQHYAAKLWTNHERRAAQARAFQEHEEYILPVRLDETEIAGILPTTAYLRWPPETADTISDAIIVKLRKVSQSGTPISAPQFGGEMAKSPAVQARNIGSFQRDLERLYGGANKGLTIDYMYGYLCRQVGYLCRNVENNAVSVDDFIRSLSWLFSLASRIGADVQDALFSKYPNCCPYCLQNQCICFKTNKEPPTYFPAYKVKEELFWRRQLIINSNENLSFEFAVKCISATYPNNEVIWHYAGPWHHFAKLQEEVAELHEAISAFATGRKNLGAVSEELADVFAWILGAWHILFRDKSLDHEIIDYYFSGCPVCHRNPCICRAYSSRPYGLVDIKVLIELRENLEELRQVIPTNRDEVEELVKSTAIAAEAQNDSLARLALSQAAFKVKTIKESVSASDDTGKKSLAILNTIMSIIEKSTY